MIAGSSRAEVPGPRRMGAVGLAGLLLGLLACSGDGTDGTGPPVEELSHIQLEMPTYSSLLPTPPGVPLILFDSLAVPSNYGVTALQFTGTTLTTAGELDTTSGIINWAMESGGGSLAASATAPQSGHLTNTWFLGPLIPGTVQSIVLTAPGVPTYVQHVHLRVFQAPLQVEQSTAALSGSLGMTLPEPITIRLLDGNGVPLPRVPVRFSSSGTLSFPNDTVGIHYFTCPVMLCGNEAREIFSYTDANGVAAARLTVGTSVQADVGAQAEIPKQLETSQYTSRQGQASWTVAVSPGPAANVTVETGNNQAGSVGGTLALPLLARVTDQYGNFRIQEPVTWTVTSGGGSLGAPTTTTDALGMTTNTWTLGPTVGTQTVTATAGTGSGTFSAVASGP
jgi:hypothetical protein